MSGFRLVVSDIPLTGHVTRNMTVDHNLARQ